MSRIEEALKQAGAKTRLDDLPQESSVGGLESFSVGSDATPPQADRPKIVERSSPPPSRVSGVPFFERLVVHPNAEPVAVEQYRRLAAVLHQAQVERGTKVVMVASAKAAEGKTLTAANLALTLSESYGRRVVLVDADLRRPALSRLFQLPNGSGLSENLRATEEEPLNVTNLSESLSLVPGGRADSDPMAGLTSGRMEQIIQRAAASFDWVILDTPPVALLSDAHLLAAMVDAAVLVIHAGVTPHALIQRAVETIGREKIVGVVLNRVATDAFAEANYYEYYQSAVDNRRKGPQLLSNTRGSSA
jgi:receptor protein-tyrosine kinase